MIQSIVENMDAKTWLDLNAKLQKKKNALRKILKERGVLKNKGANTFDKYSYFSEAQYKELFTELFSDCGLELKFNEISYDTFTGTEKLSNGRMPRLEFELMDIDTGFGESTVITGEGIDKGDKAGYKAYTGALKYYLANTFMVATGDEAEKESPSETMNNKQEKKATPNQINYLAGVYEGENLEKLLKANGIEKLEDMSMSTASNLIAKLKKKENKG